MPNSRTLLAKIWRTVEPEFSDALKDHVEKDGDDYTRQDAEPQGIPLRRLVADWAPLSPPNDVVWEPQKQPSETEDTETSHPTFEWVSELQRRVGIVVHRMLQKMRAPDCLNFSEETLRIALRCEGLEGEKLDQAVSRAVSALKNTIGDDRGRWILSQHEDDEREYALSASRRRQSSALSSWIGPLWIMTSVGSSTIRRELIPVGLRKAFSIMSICDIALSWKAMRA